MFWSYEMLSQDRITRLCAEAARDRMARRAVGPTRVGRPQHAGWWRRLMGMPVVAPTGRPAVGRIA